MKLLLKLPRRPLVNLPRRFHGLDEGMGMDCKGIIGVFENRTFWVGMVMIMIALYVCAIQLRYD